ILILLTYSYVSYLGYISSSDILTFFSNSLGSILYLLAAISHVASNAFSMLFSSHNHVSSKSNITDFNIILSSFIIYLIFLFLLYYGIYNLSLSPSFFILIEESYFVMNLSLLNLKRS